MTAWYQGLWTIQRDDIDEATLTLMFTLGTSVSMMQHRNWQYVFFSDESRFQLFRAEGSTPIYQWAEQRTALCCVPETTVWFGVVSVANS